MARVFKEVTHDGTCGHCKTKVHPQATVCPACGARWGTSLGLSQQQAYDLARMKAMLSGLLCLVIAAFCLATMLAKSPWLLLGCVLVIAPGIPALGTCLGNLIAMRNAARAHINWWRDA